MFADQVVGFASPITPDKKGGVFTIPVALAGTASALLNQHKERQRWGKGLLTPRHVLTLQAIIKGSGRALTLGSYGGQSGLILIGAGKPLPADFAPAIILDASGRVRGTYKLWEENGGNLVRLDPAVNDYGAMRVLLWRVGCGKDALRDDTLNWPIFRAVADAIMTKPDEEWLIIGDKEEEGEHGFSAFTLIKKALPPTMGIKLHYVHWGRHMATNAYAHIRNVVVVGSHLYGNAGYDALAAAALGGDARLLESDNQRSLMMSEYQHNLLQGVMRSNARNARNGICGEATVYVVASPAVSAAAIRETFPGCILEIWKETPPSLSAKAERLLDTVVSYFLTAKSDRMKKGDAVTRAGINRKSLGSRLVHIQNASAAASATPDR
jgi:hypothetical protein